MQMNRPQRRTCGTMQVYEKILETDPAYRQRRLEIADFTSRFDPEAYLRRDVITIPVVVHVVYNTEAQNISDDQIQSQIDILNRDYRMTNSDRESVPPEFKPLAADTRIEFSLAVRDPDGNSTNGITRTPTEVASFSADNDDVKFNATGGKDAWPTNKYLNMWVCLLGGGLLGYAQFPDGGPAETDGVVITYTGFGDRGTASPPFDRGRTTTHEVGHWLNLRHIWGDDIGCSGTDNVDDTPNQATQNFGCPSFPSVSCDNGPNGDMFMNYMDYTDDTCMFMFTAGQAARMSATLAGPRAAIANSDALVPVGS